MLKKSLFLLASMLLINSTNNSFCQSSSPKDKGYAQVNGLKLYYEISGTGDPVVLLHGGLGAIEMFGDNLTKLSEKFKVIAVDLQGHGRTADIDRPIDVTLMADDIAELLKYLKINKASIVGYSIGGGVALQVAVKYPELVDKLVMISTAVRKNAYYPEILAQQNNIGPEAAEMLKQTPMYQMYVSLAPKPDDWARLVTKMGDAMKKDFDFTQDVKKIKAPAMIVAGDADLFPPSHAVEIFNLLGGGLKDGGWDGSGISNARLAILPGLTHYNIFMSPQLAQTIIPFLSSAKDMTVTRSFNAPVDEVWKAWSDPDYVKQWWGPIGFTCPLAKMDFRKDGTSLVCMNSPQFGDIYSNWHYRDIIPMQKIEYIHTFADKDGNDVDPTAAGMPADMPREVHNMIIFKDMGSGTTEVTITESGYKSDRFVDLSRQGLEQCLDKMAKIFENKETK